jgi:hypothetical protein
MYESFELKLDSTNFLEEYITVIGSMSETKVTFASKELLTTSRDILKKIAELKSFIAWFREAIKEKERLTQENEFYCSQERLDHMKSAPTRERYLTREEIIESWTIGEQEEYLTLQTRAATIGKYIHKNTPLAKAKTELSKRINNPIEVVESGRDTIIRRYQPVATEKEVEELLIKLKKEHRSIDAQIRGIDHKIDTTLREDKLKKDEAYANAKRAYDAKLQEIAEADSVAKLTRDKEIEDLKIVIPNNLRETYEYLQSLGK